MITAIVFAWGFLILISSFWWLELLENSNLSEMAIKTIVRTAMIIGGPVTWGAFFIWCVRSKLE